MAQRDVVMAQSGAFEEFRDPWRLILWFVVAAVLVVASVLAALNYEAVNDDAMSYSGRRSWLRFVVAPALVILPLLFAYSAVKHAFVASRRWRDPTTGATLKYVFDDTIYQVASEAHRNHECLATGDPRVYLPIHFGRKGEVGLSVHALPEQSRVFVGVTEHVGKAARPLPLITLEGAPARAMLQIKRRKWDARPSERVIAAYLGGATSPG